MAQPGEDDALVRACEARIVNAWPSPTTLLIGDFVVRFANGYSGRANSATPLRPGAELDAATLDLIETLYAGEGLPPRLRLTPLIGEATRRMALERGYRLDSASHGMVASLEGFEVPADGEIEFASRAEPDWIEGVCSHQVGPKRNAAHLAAIVEGVRLPAAFATLSYENLPVAYGMSVAERGMAEIGAVIVDESLRGKGHGRRLVRGLMGWARSQGCESAYLQVEQGNAGAIRLYESLGFRWLYDYETRVRDGA